MSYSFYTKLNRPEALTYERLIAVRDVGCEEAEHSGLELTGPMRPGYYHHIYLPHVSTRSLEISLEGDTLGIRIMTGSCVDDYELAIDLVCEAAGAAGGDGVEGEDGRAIDPDARDWSAEREWMIGMTRSLAGTIVGMVEREGQTVTLSGPRRAFHIGPRVAAELRAASSDAAGLEKALTARIRRTQYIDLDELEVLYAASTMVMTLEDKRELRFAVWSPGVRYLMPSVAAFALGAPEPLFVPPSALATLAGDRLQWLDEEQAILDPIPDDEWDAFIERARKYQSTPEELAGPPA
jgi:hypothetical protein